MNHPKKDKRIHSEVPLTSLSVEAIMIAFEQIKLEYPNVLASDVEVHVEYDSSDDSDHDYCLLYSTFVPNENYEQGLAVYEAEMQAKEKATRERMEKYERINRRDAEAKSARHAWKKQHRLERMNPTPDFCVEAGKLVENLAPTDSKSEMLEKIIEKLKEAFEAGPKKIGE